MQKYKINYGDAVIDEGMFLKKQDKMAAVKADYIDGRGSFFRHLSTFPEGSTIKEEILTLLKTAKRNIFFANFLIQDDDITQSLIQAAKRLHGHVYVLTTLKDQDFNAVFASEAKENDDDWNFQDHFEHIKQLTSNGIFVKARKDCHAKFMTVDDEYALITSANAVSTCYGNTTLKNGMIRHANSENGVLLTLAPEVGRLANFFRAIWCSGYNYYISPDSNTFETGVRTKDIVGCSCKEPQQIAEEGQILWTAPDDLRILSALTGMIGRANQKINISSWVIKGIGNHVLGEALKAAAKHGVKIDIA
jgi:phosphatidylserine/phosphatidylglycerophosphate/cardiolipin synthase-like enzyme